MFSRPSARPWQDRVRDILDAIAEINGFVHGMSRERFLDDRKTVRAVELNIILIGEAAAAIPDEVQAQYAEIPWHRMIGMRNRLAHGYYSVDEEILWDTIQQDLLPLRGQLSLLV